jgi:hypothetical protein
LTDLINKKQKTGDTTKTVVPATKEEAKAAIQTKAKEVKTKAAELLNGFFNKKKKNGRYNKSELTAKDRLSFPYSSTIIVLRSLFIGIYFRTPFSILFLYRSAPISKDLTKQ